MSTAGFVIGFLAHYAILTTCGLPYWSQSNWQTSDSLYGRIPTYNGIWWQCMSPKTGGFTCNNYGKPSIYVDTDVQAFRALMCIATISSFFGVLIALLGLDCTTMIEPGSKTKARTSLVAGIMFAVAGVCCGAAVSWYAWKVTMEYFHPLYQEREFKYEYGACLYIGWVAMALALIAGLILTVGSCKNMRKGKEASYSTYSYKPQVQASKSGGDKTEYV